MNWAVDTNVLLRTVDVGDAAQPIAETAMTAVQRSGGSLSIFPQNLVEFWAVATRSRANNGLGLDIEQAQIQLSKLKTMFAVLEDTPEILPEWERLVVVHQVIGKQAHDAGLVAAMRVHGVTHLLTFNAADFKRYNEITVVDPASVK